MKWATTILAIDIETGEVLDWSDKRKFKNEYKIIRKIKKINIINTEYGKIHYEWHCTRYREQYRLF